MIKAIILDFDGVILESVDVKADAFKELFSRYTSDIRRAMDHHYKSGGVSRFVKFRYIWKEIFRKEYNEETEKKIGNEFSKIVISKVIRCPFVNGALVFLKTFSKYMPIYVASAVPVSELNQIVRKKRLERYFTRIYGDPPTTKRDAIKDVMKRQNLNNKEILFVGDSIQDLEAARLEKTFFIARLNKDNFQKLNVPCFKDMKGIRDYLIKERFVAYE